MLLEQPGPWPLWDVQNQGAARTTFTTRPTATSFIPWSCTDDIQSLDAFLTQRGGGASDVTGTIIIPILHTKHGSSTILCMDV